MATLRSNNTVGASTDESLPSRSLFSTSQRSPACEPLVNLQDTDKSSKHGWDELKGLYIVRSGLGCALVGGTVGDSLVGENVPNSLGERNCW
jgi:hypothetical protein